MNINKKSIDKFYSFLVKDGECILWDGLKSKQGYGRFYYNKKHYYAHRFMLLILGEKLKPGYEVDHLCRNHACVNFMHLEQVTHKENMLRAPVHIIHGDNVPGKRSLCPRGHKYNEKNTYVSSSGHRTCRPCNRINAKNSRNRKAIMKKLSAV